MNTLINQGCIKLTD